MSSIPFEAELRKIQGGHVIIKTLQRLTENLQAVPFRVGASFIRAGVDSPEGVEDGRVGDLYLRIDGSAAGTETRVGIPIAGSEGLGSLNAPTLYTKAQQNDFTRGWTAVGAWQSIQGNEVGSHNNWPPEAQTLLGNAIYQWNGTADLTITGIPKGYNGQLFLIQNLTTTAGKLINLTHLDANSNYGNQLTNWITAGTSTQLALNGYALYVYRTDGWQMLAHDQGSWIDRTFAAGDYTGNGSMTWTVASGDVIAARYYTHGRTCTYATVLTTTTVGGTPNTNLQIAIPNGWTAVAATRGAAAALDNGTVTASIMRVAVAGTTIGNNRDINAGNWAAATDATAITGQLTFELT